MVSISVSCRIKDMTFSRLVKYTLVCAAICELFFLYSVRAHNEDMEAVTDIGRLGPVSEVDFRSDGKYFFTATYTGKLILWDVESGEPVRVARSDSSVPSYERLLATTGTLTREELAENEKHGINAAKFVNNTNLVLTGSSDTTARLWDMDTGKEIWRNNGTLAVSTVDISPDQKLIATGYWRCSRIPWWGLVRLLDAKTGKKVATVRKPMIAITKVSFSHNGKMMLIITQDSYIIIWDVSKLKRLLTLNRSGEGIRDACFSPDDSRILTGSRRGAVRLWDSSSGEKVRTFMEHHGEVTCVTISQDGRLVAAACPNEGVRIWELETGKQLHMLRYKAFFVKFSADNQKVFISDNDAQAFLWSLSSQRELRRYRIYPLTGDEMRVLYNRKIRN